MVKNVIKIGKSSNYKKKSIQIDGTQYLLTDGLKIPNGSPTASCLAKSSAKAFVNVYVLGQPAVKLKVQKYFFFFVENT